MGSAVGSAEETVKCTLEVVGAPNHAKTRGPRRARSLVSSSTSFRRFPSALQDKLPGARSTCAQCPACRVPAPLASHCSRAPPLPPPDSFRAPAPSAAYPRTHLLTSPSLCFPHPPPAVGGYRLPVLRLPSRLSIGAHPEPSAVGSPSLDQFLVLRPWPNWGQGRPLCARPSSADAAYAKGDKKEWLKNVASWGYSASLMRDGP